MYSIIIAIHAVFILLSHFLGYRFFEGIFLILCIFFLFYFSPLFFIDEGEKNEKWPQRKLDFQGIFEKFSPKDSLIIPLSLLYIAIYGFVISAFWSAESFFSIHSILSIGIFLILFWYMMSFEWKNDMFSEVFQFHTYIGFFSSILFWWLFFFGYPNTSFLFFFLSIASSMAWVFFLSISREQNIFYTSLLLSTLLSSLFMVLKYFFDFDSLNLLLSLTVIGWILWFEYGPKLEILQFQIVTIRYYGLISMIMTIPFLVFLSFSNITLTFLLLSLLMIFFLSIHVRYSNYVTYSLGLLIIYFLYSLFFISLLTSGVLFSVLIFVFFLPFLLIGMTYFWEERFEYDFMILHYSAILFSGIYSIYSIFFIWWGSGLLFMVSSCILGLAVLFFLSYFRFRKD